MIQHAVLFLVWSVSTAFLVATGVPLKDLWKGTLAKRGLDGIGLDRNPALTQPIPTYLIPTYPIQHRETTTHIPTPKPIYPSTNANFFPSREMYLQIKLTSSIPVHYKKMQRGNHTYTFECKLTSPLPFLHKKTQGSRHSQIVFSSVNSNRNRRGTPHLLRRKYFKGNNFHFVGGTQKGLACAS